jgi:acyl carrier protein
VIVSNQTNSSQKLRVSELYNIIRQIMNEPVSSINDLSGPETISSWDSFHGLILIDEIETKFNVKFTLDEVLNTKTVGDIKRNMQNHGVLFDE